MTEILFTMGIATCIWFTMTKIQSLALKRKEKENTMAKVDVVSAGVTALQAAVTQAETDQLGLFYDAVVADIGGTTGGCQV